ncbi:MAG: hypothetical protein EZS28_033030, partial [Streblomastix strix]
EKQIKELAQKYLMMKQQCVTKKKRKEELINKNPQGQSNYKRRYLLIIGNSNLLNYVTGKQFRENQHQQLDRIIIVVKVKKKKEASYESFSKAVHMFMKGAGVQAGNSATYVRKSSLTKSIEQGTSQQELDKEP